MERIDNVIEIGLDAPIRIIHASDTHLTHADMRDGERKVKLAEWRAPGFPEAEDMLRNTCVLAREEKLPIMHTGDLLDFVSLANLEAAKQFTDEYDCFMATGNHEFSLYVGEAKEDAAYRNQSLDKVQACFKNDIRMSARVIGGVNFIALDNGYYTFEPEHLDFLKQEAAKGLPMVLMFHTPLYDPALYRVAMEHTPSCAYLAGVPEELTECYEPSRREQQRADAVTFEILDYVAKEPMIKAILAGHLHFNYDGTFADRIPQIVTDCTTLRVIEFR